MRWWCHFPGMLLTANVCWVAGKCIQRLYISLQFAHFFAFVNTFHGRDECIKKQVSRRMKVYEMCLLKDYETCLLPLLYISVNIRNEKQSRQRHKVRLAVSPGCKWKRRVNALRDAIAHTSKVHETVFYYPYKNTSKQTETGVYYSQGYPCLCSLVKNIMNRVWEINRARDCWMNAPEIELSTFVQRYSGCSGNNTPVMVSAAQISETASERATYWLNWQ